MGTFLTSFDNAMLVTLQDAAERDNISGSRFASSPVFLRTLVQTSVKIFAANVSKCGSGGTGRHTILRGWRRKAWGFKSPLPHQSFCGRIVLRALIPKDLGFDPC